MGWVVTVQRCSEGSKRGIKRTKSVAVIVWGPWKGR